MSSKQLEREAKRAEKEEKAMKEKVKKAIKEQRIEFAQIHAESAIRKKNEGLNYLRLASRVDAVASKVKSAQGMKNVTKTMGQTTKQLDAAMKSMNLEKITATMDKFEKSFENLDLTTSVMEGSMGDAMATSAPSSQVDALIQQVADENSLQIANDMAAAPVANTSLTQEQQEAISFYDQSKQQQEVATQMHGDFRDRTKKLFNNEFKGFEFNLGEKRFRYGIKDPVKVGELQADVQNFVGKYTNEEGLMTDAAGYHKAMYAAMNADKLANHFYEQGKADGVKSIISGSKNPSKDEPRRVADGNVFINGLKVKAISGLDSSKLKIKTKKFN
jgi:charged multivesicular body protein 1